MFLERELSETPSQQVLDTWVSRLAPGLIAAATPGVIRTGHAVRTFAAGDTPECRDEPAAGLGHWAARYHRLPEVAVEVAGDALPSQPINKFQVAPKGERGPGGIMMGVLAAAG